MKNLILFTLILISVSFSAFSQSKQQSIKQLIAMTKQDAMIDQIFNSAAAIPALPGSTPERQAAFAEVLKRQRAVMRTIMQKFMDEDMVQIYDRNYTETEINDVIAFYKTPSGQKLITITPALQKDIMNIMSTKYLPLIMEETKKISEEMKSKLMPTSPSRPAPAKP